MARPLSKSWVLMLASTMFVCGRDVAFAVISLFFDCHGAYENADAPDFLGKPHNDSSEQIVIDVEKGLVEGPVGGPARGSNE